MFAFFDDILGFFNIIFSAITHFFKSLFYMLELIVSATSIQSVLIPLLPSIIGISVSVVLGIAVVKLLVGR